jgi:hypothetical protein
VGYVAVEILADAINFSAGIRACKKLDIKSFSRIVKALSTIRHTGIIGVRAPQALLDTQRWMLPMQSFYEGHEQCDLGLGIVDAMLSADLKRDLIGETNMSGRTRESLTLRVVAMSRQSGNNSEESIQVCNELCSAFAWSSALQASLLCSGALGRVHAKFATSCALHLHGAVLCKPPCCARGHLVIKFDTFYTSTFTLASHWHWKLSSFRTWLDSCMTLSMGVLRVNMCPHCCPVWCHAARVSC